MIFPDPSVKNTDFLFALELEYLVIDVSGRALWHQDLPWSELLSIIENIPCADIMQSGAETLVLEPPHTVNGPYMLEGYHFDGGILVKGLEIRTPTRPSIAGTVEVAKTLFDRLSAAVFQKRKMGLVPLSYHPTAGDFYGPRGKRRMDYWRWAQQAMTTFGPDINLSLPFDILNQNSFDPVEFNLLLNYFAPALCSLCQNSPFQNGAPLYVDGMPCLSIRGLKRSSVAPLIEYHPDEANRLEIKFFDMPPTLEDFHFLIEICLTLVLGYITGSLRQRATAESCMSNIKQNAIFGTREAQHRQLMELIELKERLLPRFIALSSRRPTFIEGVPLKELSSPSEILLGRYQEKKCLATILQSLA